MLVKKELRYDYLRSTSLPRYPTLPRCPSRWVMAVATVVVGITGTAAQALSSHALEGGKEGKEERAGVLARATASPRA